MPTRRHHFPINVPHDVLQRMSVGGSVCEGGAFAVVCAVPWSLVERHELQVYRNHRMGLNALADCGGLDAREMIAALYGVTDTPMRWPEANARLYDLVADWDMAERSAREQAA